MDGCLFLATQPKLMPQGLPTSQPYPQGPLDNLLLGIRSQQSSLERLPRMANPLHQRPCVALAGSPCSTPAYPRPYSVRGPPPSPFSAAALLPPAGAPMPGTAAGQLGLVPLPFSLPEPEPQGPLPDGLELLDVLTSLGSSLSQVDSSSMVPEPMGMQLPQDILAWAACGSVTAGSARNPDPASDQAALSLSHLGAANMQQQQHCLQQPRLIPAEATSRQLFAGRLLPSSAAAQGSRACCAGCGTAHGGQLATLSCAAGSGLATSKPTTPVQHAQQLMLPQPIPVLGQLSTGRGACCGSMAGQLSSCPMPPELEDLELDLDGLELPELDVEKQVALLLPPQEVPGYCLATPPSRNGSGCLRQTSSGVPMLLPQYMPAATHAGGAAALCLPLVADPDLPLAAYPIACQAVLPQSATTLCAAAALVPPVAKPCQQPHNRGLSHTPMAGSGTACGAACTLLGKRRRSWGQLASASASHELEASLECGSTAEGPNEHGDGASGHASRPCGLVTTPQAQQAQHGSVLWGQYELHEEEVAALLEPVRTLPRISEASEEHGSETSGASATSAGQTCPPSVATTCIKAGVEPPSDAPAVTFLLPSPVGGPPQPTPCSFLFQKRLTSSDTGRLGRIVLPSTQAHKWFPDIRDKAGLDFGFLDSEGGKHCVTFKYWQNGKPHKLMYLFEGTRAFCANKGLRAGCHLAFFCTPAGHIVVDTVAVEARISKQP